MGCMRWLLGEFAMGVMMSAGVVVGYTAGVIMMTLSAAAVDDIYDRLERRKKA